MSKLSFRARALDAAKPLPVYRDRELPDRTDCVSINRTVPQMPTGMEKEEELMEDFSGDTLREVSLPLLEKSAYCSPSALNSSSRHNSDVNIKKKPQCVRDELPFDPIRPKKKNVRRDRKCPPQRHPGRPPAVFTVNMANIKQYDFHSSGEDETPPPLPRMEQTGGVDLVPQCLRHSLAELARRPHWTGLSRRRIGRGGRMVLDRTSSALDPVLQQLDSLTDPVCRTLLRGSLSPGSSFSSLTEVVNSIQTLRRFCFRPKRVHVQREGDSRSTRSPSFHLSPSNSSSEPLDSASAQFAASAVISSRLNGENKPDGANG
ncbi:hypothetical protein FQN60_007333, partial [Etheostoma spectabile]